MMEKHLSKITTWFTTEHCHNSCILITLFFCWTLAILCPTTYISNNSITWTSFDQLCMLALTTMSGLSPNNNGHLLFHRSISCRKSCFQAWTGLFYSVSGNCCKIFIWWIKLYLQLHACFPLPQKFLSNSYSDFSFLVFIILRLASSLVHAIVECTNSLIVKQTLKIW